jgi:uncharacterized RDD family membrane protein YckC
MFTILGADGKEYGPVAADKVQEWIRAGRANLQTKARRADETDWKTLGDFPEFAASAPVPVITPPALPGSIAGVNAGAGLLLAGRWTRLGAQLLDGIIGAGAALPGLVLMLMAGSFSRPDHPNAPLAFAGVVALCLGVGILVVVQFYLLATRGQSLGKKMLGIRIVTVDTEANPGFVKTILLRAIVNGLIGCIPVLGGIYSIVDLCFIFREDQRCIHDLIAGTKVVVA